MHVRAGELIPKALTPLLARAAVWRSLAFPDQTQICIPMRTEAGSTPGNLM
jgi:hypothetical protein